MPQERRERALRYRSELDRYLCVLAYWLVMHGLEAEYGISTPPAFSYGDNGKPYLSEYPGIFFNVSHCKAGVVCAISDYKVGVDIQEVRPFDISVAKRVCTALELEQLSQSAEPDRLFCKMWTIKESFFKLHSGGISDSLHELESSNLFEQMKADAVSRWGMDYHICCFGISDKKEGVVFKLQI